MKRLSKVLERKNNGLSLRRVIITSYVMIIMNKTEVGESMHRRRRGIVGIDAAIILIAFVIVAAAVAFVALNMGMTASQKSKQAISKGLAQASTALEVDGDVIGYSSGSNAITGMAIPLRVAPGWNTVDLNDTNITVQVIQSDGNGKTYINILTGGIKSFEGTNINLTSTMQSFCTNVSNAKAEIIMTTAHSLLGQLSAGDKAWLIVCLPSTSGVKPYGSMTTIIKPPQGAPLTVTRYIPATVYSGTFTLG